MILRSVHISPLFQYSAKEDFRSGLTFGFKDIFRNFSDMRDHLLGYFRLLRRTAAVYLLTGVLTLIAGAILFFLIEEPLWLGLSSSVIGLSLIQLWSGTQLFRQTYNLEERLPAQLDLHPGRFRREELERCNREEVRFNKQRTVVLLLIVLGIVLTLIGGVVSRRPFTAGIGFGLCLQGAVLLVLNLTIQWHQSLYQHAVERFEGEAGG
jgi:hypothetical protein